MDYSELKKNLLIDDLVYNEWPQVTIDHSNVNFSFKTIGLPIDMKKIYVVCYPGKNN